MLDQRDLGRLVARQGGGPVRREVRCEGDHADIVEIHPDDPDHPEVLYSWPLLRPDEVSEQAA